MAGFSTVCNLDWPMFDRHPVGDLRRMDTASLPAATFLLSPWQMTRQRLPVTVRSIRNTSVSVASDWPETGLVQIAVTTV